jgi:tRNA nucleotidyltransferase (CCA-adding enzyme)
MIPQIPDASDKPTVITTHINADFDALASLLAAQKLYPDALVAFPGSQEKNLRNFFINSMVYLLNMADIKDIDFSRIKRLVLVDTRQPNRIGKFAELLDQPDIEIHVYDHHPAMANDIRGHHEVHQLTGANVTLLTKILQERKIEITPDEATILCLGIYEDTGSFTFPSTTADDFQAAAFLLNQGANLNVVAGLIDREISPTQVALLNDMIQAAVPYSINGIELTLTTVSTDDYIPEFAVLVHKMLKMEKFNAIFAVARMGKKIYIVARSRVPEVNVGEILAGVGGGGHAYAAAATIRGKTLVQAEHLLLEVLFRRVAFRRRARDLMSAPAITLDFSASCREAGQLLTRYNVNALVVTRQQNGQKDPVGFITRQIIEKALYHQLENVAVHEYMSTDMATVGPDADLTEIQDKIIENKQRILPVIEGEAIVGVVTRTDLLNILVHQSERGAKREGDLRPDPSDARARPVLKFMRERLSSQLFDCLRTIGQVAHELGFQAYVVGGFVRDLFLYRPNDDIDIVIEGDGIAFARKYGKMMGARVHTHAKFGTAVLTLAEGFKIDVASARMEYYQFPAALPTVEMSSIKLDLFRRDFTVNTLAIRLDPGRFGTLIDFFAAQRDLKDKVIRVLHNLSFVEDPTRVFRAIRFEQRFGFSIGKLTAGLIQNAVKMDFFSRLSGRRVFAELRQILEEETPAPAIVRLNDFDLLKVIHPSIQLTKELITDLSAVTGVLSWYDLLFLGESYMKWAVYFLVLTRSCDAGTTVEICSRLELAPRYQKIFTQERFEADRCLYWLERKFPLKNSKIFSRLSGFKTEPLLYLMAVTRSEQVKRAISLFFTQLRNTAVEMSGQDLKEMGVAPGPIYRDTLQAVLEARLDGRLQSLEEELAFARSFVARRRAPAEKPHSADLTGQPPTAMPKGGNAPREPEP